MSPAAPRVPLRPILASLLPVVACLIQWLAWPVIHPFVWFLFYPVVFFSSWIGGFGAGLVATGLSTTLVWWFFMPPVHALLKPGPGVQLNALMFLAMGTLFSYFHQRLRQANLRAATAELRQRDNLLAQMSRLAKVGGWEFQVDTMEGAWSEEVARIHDEDPSTRVDPKKGIGYYHEADRPLILEAVRRSIEEARPYDLELRLVSARGVLKWVRTFGVPVLENGRVVKVQGGLQDITERKRAEAEILNLNATLERRVAERTAELQVANRELESFAYAVSHDLRGPLRAMSGFSHALLEDCAAQLPEDGRNYVAQIIQASRRMAGLIDGLLQLSHTSRCDLNRVPVDLSALAGSLLAEMARGEPERRVRTRIEAGIRVVADPATLEALLLNLLGNAWKYTSRTAAPSISLDTVLEADQRWIRITDNGCGFDMAFASKLFQPFQRLHRQDEFPGLGIGLATARRIVLRHGGELKAISAPGAGASFLLTLPSLPPMESP